MPVVVYQHQPVIGGFDRLLLLIEPMEDLRAVIQNLSLDGTMFVWACAPNAFLSSFTVRSFMGERVHVVPDQEPLWEVASLHSLSGTSLYLMAIRANEWVYGVVEGPLLCRSQLQMWFGRFPRTPAALNQDE